MNRARKLYLGFIAAVVVGWVGLEMSGWAAGGTRREPVDKRYLAATQRGNTHFGGYAFYRGVRGK